MTDLELRHYDATGYSAIRETLLDIHDEIWGGTGEALSSREEFAPLADRWAGRGSWSCVVGYDHDTPIGYAYGAPLTSRTTWWSKVTPAPSDEFAAETGERTFALSELMVRARWRGTGAGRTLHDELLANRDEDRVTLLVHAAHQAVVARYQQWGYQLIGEARPFEGAPDLYAMVLNR